ncbi:hypothetical protein SAMN05421798_106177 [Pseudovibrio axinellae]|nr:hypothetical protein SAMN05421798_106177 [Pseudovibrio axinellae]
MQRGLGGATGRPNASFGGFVETPLESQQCRGQAEAGQPDGCRHWQMSVFDAYMLTMPVGDDLVSYKNARAR